MTRVKAHTMISTYSPAARLAGIHPVCRVLALAFAGLVFATATTRARAQDDLLTITISEAAAVQAVATAARLCRQISETELNHASNRIDQVHTAQLAGRDQETYLILRGSASFRNQVFAAALRRVEGGCTAEIGAAWRDVDASLVFASVLSRETLAAAISTDPK